MTKEQAFEAIRPKFSAHTHPTDLEAWRVISALDCVGVFNDEASDWVDEDQPIPEDAAIKAAHPVRSGSHAAYAEAMRMVGAKRSKGALVELVNWLLTRIPAEPHLPVAGAVEDGASPNQLPKYLGPGTRTTVGFVLHGPAHLEEVGGEAHYCGQWERGAEVVGRLPHGLILWNEPSRSVATDAARPAAEAGQTITFEQAWAEKEREGYQYGEDALEQVRFGWDIAMAHVRAGLVSK